MNGQQDDTKSSGTPVGGGSHAITGHEEETPVTSRSGGVSSSADTVPLSTGEMSAATDAEEQTGVTAPKSGISSPTGKVSPATGEMSAPTDAESSPTDAVLSAADSVSLPPRTAMSLSLPSVMISKGGTVSLPNSALTSPASAVSSEAGSVSLPRGAVLSSPQAVSSPMVSSPPFAKPSESGSSQAAQSHYSTQGQFGRSEIVKEQSNNSGKYSVPSNTNQTHESSAGFGRGRRLPTCLPTGASILTTPTVADNEEAGNRQPASESVNRSHEETSIFAAVGEDELSQQFSNLDIVSTGEDEMHQQGINTTDLQVHRHNLGKENTVLQYGQTDGVWNAEDSQKGGNSHGTHVKYVNTMAQMVEPKAIETTHDNSETTDEQEPRNVQETPQDFHEDITLVFEWLRKTDKSEWKVFPQKIKSAKWEMLRNNGIQEELTQIDGEGDSVNCQKNLADGVVFVRNSKRMLDEEADTWVNTCMKVIWEWLQRTQTVIFCEIDILKFEHILSRVQNRELNYTVDSVRGCLTVFAISSEAMDKFLKKAVPLLGENKAWKMLMKAQFSPQTLMKLERLGFRKYCERHISGLKVCVDYNNCEYSFDCHTDLHHSAHTEVEEFLSNLTSVTLFVHNLYKKSLLDPNGFFQKELIHNYLDFWLAENQGFVDILSSSEEMLSRVKEIMGQTMVGYRIVPRHQQDFQHCWSKLAQDPGMVSGLLYVQQTANGREIEIAGFRRSVEGLLQGMSYSGIPVRKLEKPVIVASSSGCKDRLDSKEKLSRGQDRSGNTDSQSGKQERSGTTNAWKTEDEKNDIADKVPSSRAQERTEDVNYDSKLQVSETPLTSHQPDQMTSDSGREQQDTAEAEPFLKTKTSGLDNLDKVKIPADLAELLQKSTVVDKLKSKLMDKRCLVNCDEVSEGFITLIENSRREDLVNTLQKLFHREVIEIGEDDPNMEETLMSFQKRYVGKLSYVRGAGRWNICFTADSKDEILNELEELKRSRCLVPLPLYARDFIAWKIETFNSKIKQAVDKSVNVSIPDVKDKQGVKFSEEQGVEFSAEQGVQLSADRKFIKHATEWLHKFVLNLELTEKTVDVDEALFFQDLQGEHLIPVKKTDLICRVDAVVDKDLSRLCATAPSGQQLMVCGDTMAATNCDCIVLPLWDGQTEWSCLQRFILKRSFLSENVAAYRSLSLKGPVTLQCNGDFCDKTLIIVPVPAEWGQGKEKERIREAYRKAFALCGEDQRTVAVCAKQCPNIPLDKPLKPLLMAIYETFSASTSMCSTVVIHTDSPQDSRLACTTVMDGIPSGWHLKPQRVPRNRSGKGTIRVQIGNIDNTDAEVIVNSTNTELIPKKGAVEWAIRNAAGDQMIDACRKLYPKGIQINGLAVTDSFNLKKAKKIYHIALSQDRLTEGNRSVLLHNLGQVILRCLVQASLDQHSSIAFPTLGSGNLGYPCADVARVMFSTISKFFREMPHTKLQTVIIVVYSKNFEAIQALKMEEISQLYTFSSEEEDKGTQNYEMRMTLMSHWIQIVHGNVFNKPWVSDVCVHGQLPSQRGETPSSAGGCHSVVLKSDNPSKDEYKGSVKNAFKHGQTVQIAAQTLRPESMKCLVSALESVLSEEKQTKLVSVIFSESEMAHQFHSFFREVEKGHLEFGEEKGKKGHIYACSYEGGAKLVAMIEGLVAPPRFKKLMNVYRKTCTDQMQKSTGTESENEEPDQCSIEIPKSLLEKVDLSQILHGVEFHKTSKERTVHISVRFQDLVHTAIALSEKVSSKSTDKIPVPEPENTDAWSRSVDELEVQALKFLLGQEFEQTFDVKENNGSWLLTVKGATSKALENQIELLRREDLQLNAEEASRLGDNVDVRSEGIEAFVKAVPSHDKAVIFALDYHAITKAKHLINVRLGKVKVTTRGRRRFDAGNSGQLDQTPPPSLEHSVHKVGPSGQPSVFTTQSGIKVSVYKTDITKLPVDGIVNAANEQLSHGGGVAAAIAGAAGFALETEGVEHIRKHGPLKVMEVVETTAGTLPCRKVLHAVGPRWHHYTDKALCRQHLVETVLNCLRKAESLGFTSIALPSISAAIFGVPQPVCAESYLSAVKKFDDLRGGSTSLKEIHFVDVSDAMISVIQGTFSAQWGKPGSSSVSQGVQPTTGGTSKQKESSHPLENLAEESGQKPLNNQPSSGASLDGKVGAQVQSPRNAPQLQAEPVGFPCLTVVGTGEERQTQITFRDTNLTVIFQRKCAVDIPTEAVVLWQDVQNIMKDSNWKQFQKTLAPQVYPRLPDVRKEMTTEGKVSHLKTMNKFFVFPVLSSNKTYTEDDMQGFVEQALNEVDLARKTSVAIPQWRKGPTGRLSNKDTEVFISGLYKAVKNYAVRSARSITEIHIVETDRDILQSMVDSVNIMIGVDQSLLDQEKSQPTTASASSDSSPTHSIDPCVICRGELHNPRTLPCGHVFCTVCIDMWLQAKPVCPSCNKIQGVVVGDQPEDGTMRMRFSDILQCRGHLWGTYIIVYNFPFGTQKENHPHAGRRYRSTHRTAYLPDTEEGRTVLMLLKVAFDRRLVFTIGQSSSTEDVGIVWNGIHHKTQPYGGPERQGYPDPDYLTLVQKELADKGVTERDLTDTQKDFIENPRKVHSSYPRGDFSEVFKERETPLH